MTQDESAARLTAFLQDRQPFTYTRFGDGDIQFIFGLRDGRTADGERNTPELAAALRQAWCVLGSHHRSLVGDFTTCLDFGPKNEMRHFTEWDQMLHWAQPRSFVHIEALLMNRLSKHLHEFHRVLRYDPREKLLIAPKRLHGACRMIDCGAHKVPLGNAWEFAADLIDYLDRHPAQVMLFCAGRATKLVMAGLLQRKPDRTYIDLGSGLDPLFYGQTRGKQVRQADARKYFGDLFRCVENAVENLRCISGWMESLNVQACLIDGTLLGAIRDGTFCPGDENDVDLGLLDGQWGDMKSLRMGTIIHGARDRGFSVEYFSHKGQLEGVKLKRGPSHIDIVRIHRHPTRPECYNLGRKPDGTVLAFVYPSHHHDSYGWVYFHGMRLRVPNDPEGFLTARYGDWRTPIAAEEFNWYEQSNRQSIREDYDCL